jgi:membrane-bound serine protease (ClpP class)
MKQKMENDTTAFLRSFVARATATPPPPKTPCSTPSPIPSRKPSSSTSSPRRRQRPRTARCRSTAAPSPASTERVDHAPHQGRGTRRHRPDSTRERLLDKLTNPNLDVLFLIAAACSSISNSTFPAPSFPARWARFSCCISLFSLNLLPVRYTAVMLLVGASS